MEEEEDDRKEDDMTKKLFELRIANSGYAYTFLYVPILCSLYQSADFRKKAGDAAPRSG